MESTKTELGCAVACTEKLENALEITLHALLRRRNYPHQIIECYA